MIVRELSVTNPTGFHLRTAGLLCEEAVKYSAHITFTYHGGSEANMKSLLSILGACIRCGDDITLRCEGEDEKEAAEAISDLIEGGFVDAIMQKGK